MKTMLALDGGGMRGAFTLGVLGEIESMLARELSLTGDRRDQFVLADYFDFIGGTSTGAIIATGLSLGWSVDHLKALYRDLGREVFKKRRFAPLRLYSKYPGKPIKDQLDSLFGDLTLGSSDLRTLLMIVIHNRSTGRQFVITNNPRLVYNRGDRPDWNNLRHRLADLLAASTAAPAFFPPVSLDLGTGSQAFVDGGVTAHNNPSVQMFLAATVSEYDLAWSTGPDQLMLTSIGTGFIRSGFVNAKGIVPGTVLGVAVFTPIDLMLEGSKHNDIVCRSLAFLRHGDFMDEELGRLSRGLPNKLFSYARYNLQLSEESMMTYGIDTPWRELARLDAFEHVDTLVMLGERYAKATVRPGHFEGFVRLRAS